jgi:hypothetical protein
LYKEALSTEAKDNKSCSGGDLGRFCEGLKIRPKGLEVGIVSMYEGEETKDILM